MATTHSNNKIKKIQINGTSYDICDPVAEDAAASAQTRATQNVNTINGYSYSQINGDSAAVTFANTAITDAEIESAVSNIGK